MERIDKIFKNVKPINHSGNSGQGKNILRIKDRNFSINSIYKILEHMNWLIYSNLTNLKFKVIIESEFINDEATLMLFEAIIYYIIKEYDINISYRFEIRVNVIGYELFKNSLLYKYNKKIINKELYINEYEKNLIIDKTHYRKRCINSTENLKGRFLSITMEDIINFLKHLNVEEKYSEELAEVIIEIIGNALEHSNGDCLLNINVLYNAEKKYKYIDVALLDIDEICFGTGIKRYIEGHNYEGYTEKNKIVLEAYNKQKRYFNANYDLESFTMISAFQKYVTTRKDSINSGGTGLTTLIKALIDKSDKHFCYAISGNTILKFIRKYLILTEEGLIGFNENNNYIENIPSSETIGKTQYNINANIYNLQFILKER